MKVRLTDKISLQAITSQALSLIIKEETKMIQVVLVNSFLELIRARLFKQRPVKALCKRISSLRIIHKLQVYVIIKCKKLRILLEDQ